MGRRPGEDSPGNMTRGGGERAASERNRRSAPRCVERRGRAGASGQDTLLGVLTLTGGARRAASLKGPNWMQRMAPSLHPTQRTGAPLSSEAGLRKIAIAPGDFVSRAARGRSFCDPMRRSITTTWKGQSHGNQKGIRC